MYLRAGSFHHPSIPWGVIGVGRNGICWYFVTVYTRLWTSSFLQSFACLKMRYGWAGVDSLCGSNAAFINELDDLGETFMADINKTTKVWTNNQATKRIKRFISS